MTEPNGAPGNAAASEAATLARILAGITTSRSTPCSVAINSIPTGQRGAISHQRGTLSMATS